VRQSEFLSKVKEATVAELEQMLGQEREGMFKMRQQLAMKQLMNPHALGGSKKNVARIIGEMKAREANKGKGS
jgi:ribosomal protein L29